MVVELPYFLLQDNYLVVTNKSSISNVISLPNDIEDIKLSGGKKMINIKKYFKSF